jgi:hypothetical protein
VVFDQKVETWVDLHVKAFEWFNSVPRRVVLDNLKSGIVKAVLHDAEAQRSYRELAEHYNFLISPCRPATPQHKGKVEQGGVHYVKRNALAGRDFADDREANAHLERWTMEVAGVRDHGTTREQPLVRFARERELLQPLPATRYEVTTWKRAKLHRDCHVVFEGAYYSAPHRLVGKTLWVKATSRRVELQHEHAGVATHDRASRRGEWKTHPDHLPPDKLAGLLPQPAQIRATALTVGPATTEFIDLLLGERPMDRLRGAQAIVKLRRRVGAARLEAACGRALFFGEVRYHTVKTILKKGLDLEPLPATSGTPTPLPKTAVFARPTSDFLPTL